ncbi:hypothetical protein IPJ72_03210 [Candidatus Peregrinibacteria bacterium]|nr:MAG: hypothetical protein IPJ72_03210 [Candidatus Peregrinibacteria bacterium]
MRHQWVKISGFAEITARLVYVNRIENGKEVEYLRAQIADLQAQITRTYDQNEIIELQERLDGLESELNAAEGENKGGAPLYSFANRLNNLQESPKKARLETMINELKKPIENADEFRRTVDDWQVAQKIIANFQRGSVDFRTLNAQLEMNLTDFLSESERAQLEIGQTIASSTDQVAQLFNPLEKDHKYALTGSDSRARDNAKQAVTKKLLERDQSLKLMERIPREIVDKLYTLHAEAQSMREAQLRAYFEKKHQALNAKVDGLSDQGVSQKQKKDLRHFINGVAERIQKSEKLFESADGLIQLERNFSEAEHILNDVKTQTEAIEDQTQLQKKIDKLEKVFAGLNYTNVTEWKRAMIAQEEAINGGPIKGEQRRFLDGLPDNVREQLQQIKSTLAREALSPEERLEIQDELNGLLRLTAGLEFCRKNDRVDHSGGSAKRSTKGYSFNGRNRWNERYK